MNLFYEFSSFLEILLGTFVDKVRRHAEWDEIIQPYLYL